MFITDPCVIHTRSISNSPNLSACRHVLIHAADEPTTKELEAGAAQSAKDNVEDNLLAVPSSTVPTAIPEFWLTALRNHVGLSELVTDRDAGSSTSLTSVSSIFPLTKPSPGSSSSSSFLQTNISRKWRAREDVCIPRGGQLLGRFHV